MAAVCDICGKKPFFGKAVTFSHKRNNRRWDPNVQKVRALVDGTPRRVNACTSCIKAGKVTRIPAPRSGPVLPSGGIRSTTCRPGRRPLRVDLSVPYSRAGPGRPRGASGGPNPVR